MNKDKNSLRDFYILWGTQSFSQLGSAITAFALTLWIYEKTASALSTAALTICTYAPYVAMSIFAGAVSDKFDKKKTMLICDSLAAAGTVAVLILYRTGMLDIWHLYGINFLTGLMNTVQQPASEVAYTRIIPKKDYQKTAGLQSLSRSVVSIGNPVIAAALYGLAGLDAAIAADLFSFGIAFFALAFWVEIPDAKEKEQKESILRMAKDGLSYLRQNPMILDVILFMAGVNLIASAFDAVLPALILPKARGGNDVLGYVSACAGAAMVAGSMMATVMPKPDDRVKIIYLSMLFSLGTENFFLAFSDSPVLWCVGQVLGWILVPVMSTNLNVILRNTIPENLQGRVFACRNTLQFFTIPIGLLTGGLMVDRVCEPLMRGSLGVGLVLGLGGKMQGSLDLLHFFFGSGKGSGAALMMFLLGVAGTAYCLVFGNVLRRYHFRES